MNLRIGAQLGIALGFLLLMIVFTICLGVGGTHKVNESVEEIAKGSYNRTTYSFQASKGFDDAIASIRMLVILKDMNAMNLEKQKIETAMGRYSEAMNKLDEMEKTGNGKRLIANLKDVAAPAVKANNAVMELALAHKQDEAVALLLNKALPLAQQVEEAFAVQTKFQHENVDAAYKRSKAVYTRTKLIQIIGGVLSAFLGLLAAVYLTRHLSSRLKNLAIAMGRIAEGDFSRQINISGNDEIGELGCRINQMQASVKSMITAITGTASEVAASANMLNLVSEQIASSSGEVAGQAGTVATASEQMAATSTEIAHNCNTAAESSRQGNELAAEGAQVVMETVASMNDIAERVKQTASTLERLGSRSDQIGEIVGTIEDIADQTNLLALNAAIEAARAGEQGRGFAVVADEVRALAERTTKATKEIAQMIRAIQNETKGAIMSMEEGVTEVERGAHEAARSGTALDNIINQINAVALEINQIATAAEEQTATTTEITSNIQMITEVVQMSASCSIDAAGAAKELLADAEKLQHLVGKFNLAA